MSGPYLVPAALFFLLASSAFAEEPLPASPTDIRPILVGTEVPDVTVLDLEGNDTSLAAIVTGPTVLIFYRGGW